MLQILQLDLWIDNYEIMNLRVLLFQYIFSYLFTISFNDFEINLQK